MGYIAVFPRIALYEGAGRQVITPTLHPHGLFPKLARTCTQVRRGLVVWWCGFCRWPRHAAHHRCLRTAVAASAAAAASAGLQYARVVPFWQRQR